MDLLPLDRNPVFSDTDFDAIGILLLAIQFVAHGRSRDDEDADNEVESVTTYAFWTLSRYFNQPMRIVAARSRAADWSGGGIVAATTHVSIRPAARAVRPKMHVARAFSREMLAVQVAVSVLAEMRPWTTNLLDWGG